MSSESSGHKRLAIILSGGGARGCVRGRRPLVPVRRLDAAPRSAAARSTSCAAPASAPSTAPTSRRTWAIRCSACAVWSTSGAACGSTTCSASAGGRRSSLPRVLLGGGDGRRDFRRLADGGAGSARDSVARHHAHDATRPAQGAERLGDRGVDRPHRDLHADRPDDLAADARAAAHADPRRPHRSAPRAGLGRHSALVSAGRRSAASSTWTAACARTRRSLRRSGSARPTCSWSARRGWCAASLTRSRRADRSRRDVLARQDHERAAARSPRQRSRAW